MSEKRYTKDPVKPVTGIIGFIVLAVFILGLSHSISTGFAGFMGGLPFMLIAILVLAMAFYDYWDECLRKRK
ncbi:MAG: DUF2244 domain-containing protein [Alphaproteobacteria bacterium]|nr:DUF2244 domain-containing protein [Alphaproteobacteria bacterium]